MNTSYAPVRTAGLQIAGFLLCSMTIGAVSAGAETFQHGGSTATIEQSGGSGTRRSQVTRYQDGQKIVTQDGNSTDITIQGSGSSPALDDAWGYAQSDVDRFDRQSSDERFSRIAPDGRSADSYPDYRTSSAREEFKQRILDRTRGRFTSP